MTIERLIAAILSVSLMLMGAGTASGQIYPSKPIRIVTAPAGGTVDLITRVIAQELSASLGQNLITDNRAVILGIENVLKSPPDGYTLLVVADPLWIGPLLQKRDYDPVRDFSPISAATRAPNVLVVHPSLPVKSVGELIALARAKPGALNYSTTGGGSLNQLAAELLKAMANVNIVQIGYNGTGPALSALISGEVQVTFATPGSLASQMKSGRLRALAVTSKEPSALFPGLPTVAAAGLPGYEATSTQAMFAPAKTAEAIINRLNQEMVRLLNRSDVKEKFLKYGLETVGTSPEELAATVKSEMARMGKVIKDAGIKAE